MELMKTEDSPNSKSYTYQDRQCNYPSASVPHVKQRSQNNEELQFKKINLNRSFI